MGEANIRRRAAIGAEPAGPEAVVDAWAPHL